MSEDDKSLLLKISASAQEIKKIRPGYESLIDIYEKIFVAQEQSRSSTVIPAITISEETFKKKTAEQFPLANISDFIVDAESAGSLLKELCVILRDGENELSGAAAALHNAITAGALDLAALHRAFLGENEHFFDKASESIGIDKGNLAFFIYNSAKPSLVLFAEKISPYLDRDHEWTKGFCPICGSPAALAMFDKDGKRSLCCGFCWHQWATRRIFCNSCENTDHETLRYYSFENEEDHRVDVCDKCKSYIKTVDCRNVSRFVYPPLEYISTPHLDIRMREMGFASRVHP